MAKMKNPSFRILLEIIELTLGSIIAAAALELFLIPNTILDGGVTGISIIIYKTFHIPLGILVVLLNVPFIFIGYKNLGKRFLFRTFFSMILFSIFLSFFECFTPLT